MEMENVEPKPMTGSVPRVRVEFYGLARQRAGCAGVSVEAATLGAALLAVEAQCPELRPTRNGAPSPEYLLSIGGTRFTADLTASLTDGDCLLILGADAGG